MDAVVPLGFFEPHQGAFAFDGFELMGACGGDGLGCGATRAGGPIEPELFHAGEGAFLDGGSRFRGRGDDEGGRGAGVGDAADALDSVDDGAGRVNRDEIESAVAEGLPEGAAEVLGIAGDADYGHAAFAKEAVDRFFGRHSDDRVSLYRDITEPVRKPPGRRARFCGW